LKVDSIFANSADACEKSVLSLAFSVTRNKLINALDFSDFDRTYDVHITKDTSNGYKCIA